MDNKYLYITASSLPVILGKNDYNNLYDLARERVGIIEKPYTSNRYTRNGQLMEPKVRDYINKRYGFSFKPEKTVDSIRYYKGNCDGLDLNYKALLEIKTFMKELKVDYYRPQCEFYMELFDIPVCLLVGYKTNENFFNGDTYIDKKTGEIRDSIFESCYNSNFDENRIVIHRFFRDKNYFSKLEEKINIFQGLLNILNSNREMTKEEFYNIYYTKMKGLLENDNGNKNN